MNNDREKTDSLGGTSLQLVNLPKNEIIENERLKEQDIQEQDKEISDGEINYELNQDVQNVHLKNDVHFDLERKYNYVLKAYRHYYGLNRTLPNTIAINNFLNKTIVLRFIYISLTYHIFVYLYLGIIKGGGAFYTGLLYSILYSGALMAYWIIYRQNKPLLSWSNIISRELVTDIQERIEERSNRLTLKTIDNYKEELLMKLSGGNLKTECNRLTQLEFMEENITYLLLNKKALYSFYNYCKSWEKCAILILIGWNGVAIGGVIIKLLPDDIISFGKTFDDEPIALWGYYNYSGQFIASIGILNAAVIMFSGFYQLRCMILSFASRIRDWRYRDLELVNNISNCEINTELTEDEKEAINNNFKDTRKEYLYLQKCCVTLSDIWSTPVVAIIFFCTEVIIINIFVINYKLTKCGTHHSDFNSEYDYCDFFIGYSFVWMAAALMVAGILVYGVSTINSATDKIKSAFICADSGLTDLNNEKQLVKSEYYAIGGRNNWLQYIDSNPIRFTICGITVTATYAVNTGYMLVSTLGTFLISYLFTDDSDL